MLLWIIRCVYLMIIVGTAARITQEYSSLLNARNAEAAGLLLFTGIVGLGLMPLVLDVIYRHKRISSVGAIYFGLLVGSLLGHLLSLAFSPAIGSWLHIRLEAPFSLVLTTMLCYICVSILLQTKNNFRFLVPYVEFSRQVKGARSLILDSATILDGRIADIADTGLIDQTLVVPRSVLLEVQSIADSSDKARQKRGRYGLDILERLQECPRVELEIHEEEIDTKPREETHLQLIALAQALNGKLVTTDLNLVKAAAIQKVETVNINDISNAAKPPVRQGDVVAVHLDREGEQPGQGIGFLPDGTMVVAEMGKRFVGLDVNLIITSVLQTSGGRMAFGRIDSKNPEPACTTPS